MPLDAPQAEKGIPPRFLTVSRTGAGQLKSRRVTLAGSHEMGGKSADQTRGRPKRVPGPEGKLITLDDLPPADTTRWVVRRKAIVAYAVRGGLISPEEAQDRWHLSFEESSQWQMQIDRHGVHALSATRAQMYRITSRDSTRAGSEAG